MLRSQAVTFSLARAYSYIREGNFRPGQGLLVGNSILLSDDFFF
jgi:hypothetical protein